ncbi:MAG: tetratricopeptide repeat protein [bacterium]|nr:tetratricopeptide repeat protein [bacterium]
MNSLVPENLIDQLLASVRQENIPAARAIQYVDQVLSTFRKIGLSAQDPEHTLVVLVNIGESYEVLSSLEKATGIYIEALALSRSQNDTRRQADILWKLGSVNRKRNRWEDALSYLGDSKVLQEPQSTGLAWCWINEGLIKSSLGRYDEAIEAFDFGLEIGEKRQSDRIIAAANMNKGIIDSIRGDFERAARLFTTCVSTYEQLDRPTQKAFAFHNLGMCYSATSNHPNALDAFEKSIHIALETGDLILTALNYVHKAAVYLELNDRTIVASYCARALDTFREVDYPLGVAETYKILGRLYTLKEDWATAQGLLAESLRLCEQYEKPLGVAEVRREMGKLYFAQGEMDSARSALESAHAQFDILGARREVFVTLELLRTL